MGSSDDVPYTDVALTRTGRDSAPVWRKCEDVDQWGNCKREQKLRWMDDRILQNLSVLEFGLPRLP